MDFLVPILRKYAKEQLKQQSEMYNYFLYKSIEAEAKLKAAMQMNPGNSA